MYKNVDNILHFSGTQRERERERERKGRERERERFVSVEREIYLFIYILERKRNWRKCEPAQYHLGLLGCRSCSLFSLLLT